VYSLDAGPLGELDAWLSSYRRFWTERLDELEDHLTRSRAKEER
jgi:hypothetical protein